MIGRLFRFLWPREPARRGLILRFAALSPLVAAVLLSTGLYLSSAGLSFSPLILLFALLSVGGSYLWGLGPGWITGALVARRIGAGGCSAWTAGLYGTVVWAAGPGVLTLAATLLELAAGEGNPSLLQVPVYAGVFALIGFAATLATWRMTRKARRRLTQPGPA
jgi:hypothetical protein